MQKPTGYNEYIAVANFEILSKIEAIFEFKHNRVLNLEYFLMKEHVFETLFLFDFQKQSKFHLIEIYITSSIYNKSIEQFSFIEFLIMSCSKI